MELCLNHAAEVDRMRQRLIAVLGHDLRNPLQSISMAAALLSSSDTRTTELRQHISASSSRMERLVSQILDMSRLQSGIGLTVNPVDTDVSQLVRQIVCETDVAYPGLVIEIAIDPQVRAVVDPDRYAQVAANLLSNARHHGLPGRPVLVTLTRQGDEVCLSVLNETSGLRSATGQPVRTVQARVGGQPAQPQRPRYRPVHLPGHRPGPPGAYRRGLPRRRHHLRLRLPVRQAETGSSS